MKNKNITIVLLIAVILILIFYILNSLNTNTSFSKVRQATLLINKAFPEYNVIKNFDTGIGLEGFILQDKSNSDKKSVTFTSMDGSIIVNGNLYAWDHNESKLTSLNNIYVNSFSSSDTARNIYINIKKHGSFIQQGSNKAPHKFYAIIDPNCKYCNFLFQASQPAIKQGLLAVRWIPIGSFKNSLAVVNSIFNSKDPSAALVKYHKDKSYDKKLTSDNKEATDNLSLLKDISSFPTIVYKTPQGAVKLSGGSKLPLDAAKIAQKNNIKKVDEFLLLTSKEF